MVIHIIKCSPNSSTQLRTIYQTLDSFILIKIYQFYHTIFYDIFCIPLSSLSILKVIFSIMLILIIILVLCILFYLLADYFFITSSTMYQGLSCFQLISFVLWKFLWSFCSLICVFHSLAFAIYCF